MLMHHNDINIIEYMYCAPAPAGDRSALIACLSLRLREELQCINKLMKRYRPRPDNIKVQCATGEYEVQVPGYMLLTQMPFVSVTCI